MRAKDRVGVRVSITVYSAVYSIYMVSFTYVDLFTLFGLFHTDASASEIRASTRVHSQ